MSDAYRAACIRLAHAVEPAHERVGRIVSRHGEAEAIELLRESPRVLLQVLSDARKAADLVCPESGGELSP